MVAEEASTGVIPVRLHYLYVACNLAFGLDPAGLGWFSLFVLISQRITDLTAPCFPLGSGSSGWLRAAG